jgi:hypothetical protein
MSLQTSITQVILEVGITTISELAKNLIYFILIYWGIRKISKEMPGWINKYHENQIKLRTLDRALERKKEL